MCEKNEVAGELFSRSLAPCVRIISLDQQTIYYSSATHYFLMEMSAWK